MAQHRFFAATRWLRALAWLALASASSALWAQPATLLFNPGDRFENDRFRIYNAWRAPLEQALLDTGLSAVKSRFSNDTASDLGAARANLHTVLVAPAPTIGTALRYGYQPVLGLGEPARAVLVTLQDSGIDHWDAAKGRRLGLPGQDSVVTYLLRGEVQASNTTLARQYAELYQTRYQEALLICLQVRRCEVVAVEANVAAQWQASGKPVQTIWQSREVPGLSLAVLKRGTLDAEALRHNLLTELRGHLPAQLNTHLAAQDFDYVSTLGYFTPRLLAGATLVEDPTHIAQLLAQGARYIDTRNREEFQQGHVPGAELVPYVEQSAKDPGYDPNADQFNLQALGPDKAQALIFGCNGAECWKSFKASHAAVQAGFKQVYWFRTGFPAWRDAGQPIGSNAASQQAG